MKYLYHVITSYSIHYTKLYELTYFKWKSLKENGVDNTYNDFCIPMKVENAYGVFWEDSRYGNIK